MCVYVCVCARVYTHIYGLPGESDSKESACNARDPNSIPESGRSLSQEDPWRREGLPTPVFLSGEFHGQRSLSGYSSWVTKNCT